MEPRAPRAVQCPLCAEGGLSADLVRAVGPAYAASRSGVSRRRCGHFRGFLETVRRLGLAMVRQPYPHLRHVQKDQLLLHVTHGAGDLNAMARAREVLLNNIILSSQEI